jgi:hypothetical protein
MAEERVVAVGAEKIEIAVNHEKSFVAMFVHGLAAELGLAQDILLAIQLSPEEARQIAGSLQRMAASAEGGSSR